MIDTPKLVDSPRNRPTWSDAQTSPRKTFAPCQPSILDQTVDDPESTAHFKALLPRLHGFSMVPPLPPYADEPRTRERESLTVDFAFETLESSSISTGEAAWVGGERTVAASDEGSWSTHGAVHRLLPLDAASASSRLRSFFSHPGFCEAEPPPMRWPPSTVEAEALRLPHSQVIHSGLRWVAYLWNWWSCFCRR